MMEPVKSTKGRGQGKYTHMHLISNPTWCSDYQADQKDSNTKFSFITKYNL